MGQAPYCEAIFVDLIRREDRRKRSHGDIPFLSDSCWGISQHPSRSSMLALIPQHPTLILSTNIRMDQGPPTTIIEHELTNS